MPWPVLLFEKTSEKKKLCTSLTKSCVTAIHGRDEMKLWTVTLSAVRAQLTSKQNRINLFSPADTPELFVITPEKSSQIAETYGEKKTKIQN